MNIATPRISRKKQKQFWDNHPLLGGFHEAGWEWMKLKQLDSAPEARLITNLVLLVCTSNLVFPQPGDDGSNWTAMPRMLQHGHSMPRMRDPVQLLSFPPRFFASCENTVGDHTQIIPRKLLTHCHEGTPQFIWGSANPRTKSDKFLATQP